MKNPDQNDTWKTKETDMKKRLGYHLILAAIMVLVLTGITFSGEKATKEEVVAKAGDAAKMIRDTGRDETIKKMTGPKNPFIWKNAHIFLMDAESGILLAHKNQAFVGFQMTNYKDAEGGYPYTDVLEFAKKSDSGWKTYMTKRRGKTPLLKHSYYLKLADENIILCSGYYPATTSDAAQAKATRADCVAKVDQAVKEINEKGPETALKNIDDPKGPYVWKDSYVFCINDEDGNLLAHPFLGRKGFPMKNYRDADGNKPFVDILKIANTDGKGWKSYMFVRSGEAPKLKITYFVKIPDKNIIVASGYTD